jgi:DeoR family fructose operon transcriptional repressor
MNDIRTRQRALLEALTSRGELSVAELVALSGVSDMTIRRNLVRLEKVGRVERTWGGARVAGREALDFSFRDKARRREVQKDAIGRAAAALVGAGQSVFIDTGTTALSVARALRLRRDLTVFTCSLPIVGELLDCPGVTTVMLGGTVRADTLEVYGPLTERNFTGLRADLAFLGADAVGADGELLTSGMETARVAELISQVSRKRVLVVDSSKWQASASVRYGDLSSVDIVVTDAGLSVARRRFVKKQGPGLVIA